MPYANSENAKANKKAYQKTDRYKALYAARTEKRLAAQRERRALSPEAHRSKNKEWRLKNYHNHRLQRYGLKHEDYERMLNEQGGQWAICQKDNPGQPRLKHFSVDHCHETGKIRGLL